MVGWHPCLYGHELEQAPGESGADRGAWCAAVLGVPRALRVEHDVDTEQPQSQTLRGRSRPSASALSLSPFPEVSGRKLL